MARVTIGGKDYEVDELNFCAVERCWNDITNALARIDPMASMASGIRVIAAGLMEMPNFKMEDYGFGHDDLDTTLGLETQMHDRVTYFLKKKLKASELGNIAEAVFAITSEAGLELTPGELTQIQSLLTGTALGSSLNSLQPDVKEVAGTA